MRIEKIRLENFRCFEELEVEFREDYTLLVGVNGAGKSSILEAVSIALGSFISEFSGISGNTIPSEDAHYKYYPIGSRVERQPQFPVVVEAKGNFDGNEIEWIRSVNREGGNTTVIGAKKVKEYARGLNDRVMRGDQSVILPLISYYGTARLWMQKRQKKNNTQDIRLTRQNGYVDCLSSAANEKFMLKWFEEMTYYQLEEGREIAELSAVKRALECCCKRVYPDAQKITFNFNIKTKDLEIFIRRENGEEEILPTRLLSDGIKGVLGLVADIAYRMALLNPQLLHHINETPGIVLIDEIDMHLHPSWQKTIINDLKDAFPNVQFIFTTHSPSILSNVYQEHILILDENKVYHPTDKTYGRDVDSILKQLMEVDVRPDGVVQKLRDFSDSLEEGNLSLARRLLDELELILGSNDSEIISAKVALDLEEL